MEGAGVRRQRRSSAERVESYTRKSVNATYVVFGCSELVLALPGIGRRWDSVLPWLLVPLTVAQCVLAVVVTGQAMTRRLAATAPRPHPWPVCALGVVTALLLAGFGALAGTGLLVAVYLLPAGLSFVTSVLTGSYALLVARRRTVAVIAAVPTVCVAVLLAGLGLNVYGVVVSLLVGAFSTASTAATVRCSAWVVSVVRELAAAREAQARLAVAEERLRFGRDLHDVLGRNLAVIALKGELAVQLARRGRPEAVEQMVEVQRIAQESQAEVREVVRGYRTAGLRSELTGALSVLRAAGVAARIEGDDGTALPPVVQSALAWVVREGTTNVLRHGDARTCVIGLRAGPPGPAVLTMENDGVDAARPPGSGSGLAGLRERLAALDGTLAARPCAPDGFRLTATVPWPSGTAADEASRPATDPVEPAVTS
ncbi:MULTISPECIES: sensor histidine kinase [Streptomycetaceae]|uniref:Sensor kinase n=1 Tax=Streptantibioticus cattleyicolor (strain ATCC 35852 / DSM 46488 / JCM 4925 / NBRC 14057 / NRRL 8057) TaxID=1003195 RepID=F8JVK9_STREN|nr:sensor histidine kinase [Streptantibioticus cattleyicolor]AEW95708.1 sensor kinase [Streptantibioticus cattleyicolor NRRL 8057 = DSM 46488]MYS60254.1 sensor histidine kinase [Streptomyces sp. SID5468]CCB76047.1 putative sensor kinase [Streptantibioticus cattleyicolor NRRL 8057 = DSM 46488]